MHEYPSGIKFPFRFAAAGGVETVDGSEKVMSNLKALVLSNINDRVIRKVGTIGYQQVLRSSIQLNAGPIESLIREAIVRYEPRAIGVDVKLYPQEIQGNFHVFIDISFVFKFTGDPVKTTIQLN